MNWQKSINSVARGLFVASPALAYLALRGKRWQRVASDASRVVSSEFGSCLPEKDVYQTLSRFDCPGIRLDLSKCSIGVADLVGLLQCVVGINARRIFEFGTATGGTTWHLAANLPPDGSVTTLDLDTSLSRDGIHSERSLATCRPTADILGSEFRHTAEESKIVQLVGDSRAFDTSPYKGMFDVVFVDAGHTLELATNDTQKAFQLVRPGGIVAWHDYFVFHPDYGVRDLLDGLAGRGMTINRFVDGLAAYAVMDPKNHDLSRMVAFT